MGLCGTHVFCYYSKSLGRYSCKVSGSYVNLELDMEQDTGLDVGSPVDPDVDTVLVIDLETPSETLTWM